MLALSAPITIKLIGEETAGWQFFFSDIVPALVPPLFFVYPLDMTMCRVKMDGADDESRDHLKRMIALNAFQMVFLLAAWLPFFYVLIQR